MLYKGNLDEPLSALSIITASIRNNCRMKNLIVFICLTLSLFIINLSTSMGADLKKGLKAILIGDTVTAKREWLPLAKRGNSDAQYNLGRMHHKGKGVPQNYKAAVEWYTLAAKNGNVNAQANLGVMYHYGEGVQQNFETAVKLYTVSAREGFDLAQSNLGYMYENGKGVTKNYRAAMKWYSLAAKKGNAIAQINLGMMYANGRGVPHNNVRAFMWLNIASLFKEKTAVKNRDKIARSMSIAQIKTAQRLAIKCIKNKYKGC